MFDHNKPIPIQREISRAYQPVRGQAHCNQPIRHSVPSHWLVGFLSRFLNWSILCSNECAGGTPIMQDIDKKIDIAQSENTDLTKRHIRYCRLVRSVFSDCAICIFLSISCMIGVSPAYSLEQGIDHFASNYMHGVLDESLSAMSFIISTSTGGPKEVTLRLSKHEHLGTRAALICFRELFLPCPDEMIELYRKAMIEPYVYQHNITEMVPRTAIEGLTAGLTINEMFSLNQFVGLLSPRLCYDEGATKSLKTNVKNTFSAGERLAWQNRNFHTQGHYVDIHRAYVPCETTWWVPGKPLVFTPPA